MKEEHLKLVKRLVKKPSDIFYETNAYKCSLLHPVLGIVGEVLELIEAVEADKRNWVLEESGDLMFYLLDFKIVTKSLDASSRKKINQTEFNEVLRILRNAAKDLLDYCKKTIVYNQKDLEPIMLTAIEYIEICNEIILKEFKFTLNDARKHNIEKLNRRYPEGYSDHSAKARHDKR